jgi:hypothetical protein
MSFKFGNDIFITFEMATVAYSRPVDKIYISLQFRPSVIRGPWIDVSSAMLSSVETSVSTKRQAENWPLNRYYRVTIFIPLIKYFIFQKVSNFCRLSK